MRLGKTTIVHFGSQVLLTAFGFAATFFIARFFGAEVFGVYTTVVALVAWLKIPSGAIANAINKRVSEGRDPGAYLGAGFTLNVVLGVVLAGLALVFAGPLESYVGRSLGPYLAGLLLANVAFGSVFQALQGQKRIASAGFLSTGERMLRTGLQIGLVLLAGLEFAGLLAGHVASLFVAGAVGLALFRNRPTLPSRRHLRRIVEYARYSWLSIIESRTFAWMDVIVLQLFVASSLVGIYRVAWTVASLFALVSLSIKDTLFPELSELGVTEDYERVHHYLEEGLVFAGIFAIPGLFGAVVLGQRVLKIFRPEFSQGATVLLVLIVARLFFSYGVQFRSAINAIDRPDIAFRINGVFILTNLVLNVVLVWRFGWYGAAVATTASAVLSTGMGVYAILGLIGRPSLPFREIGLQVVASVVMVGVVAGIARVAPRSHYATLGLAGVGGVVYVLVVLGLSERVRAKFVSLVPGGAAA